MVYGKSPRHRSSVLRSTSYLRLPTSPTDLVRGRVLLHACSSRRTEVDAFRTAWIAARRAAYAHVARANIVWFPPRPRPTNHHVDGSAFSSPTLPFFLPFLFFWEGGGFCSCVPNLYTIGTRVGKVMFGVKGAMKGRHQRWESNKRRFVPIQCHPIDRSSCKKRDSRAHWNRKEWRLCHYIERIQIQLKGWEKGTKAKWRASGTNNAVNVICSTSTSKGIQREKNERLLLCSMHKFGRDQKSTTNGSVAKHAFELNTSIVALLLSM